MRHAKSPRGASKTGRAEGAGRVILAAIVHYGSSGGVPAAGKPEPATEQGRRSTPNPSPTDKSSLKRLGRLFFSKKKQQASATLIDDTPGGPGNLAPHLQNGTANRQTTAAATTHQEPPKQAKKRASTSDSGREQVIEFKFDLIVDQKWGLSGKDSALSWPASLSAEPGIHDWKLAELLDELVGSSVLESNDVCVMSVGRQQVAAPADGCLRSDFTYVCQLAAHTLQYSFHLLEQSRLAQQAPAGPANQWTTPFEFSVELSASLVVLGGQAEAPTPPNYSLQPRLQIVDLVSGATHDSKKTNGLGRPETDCDESYPRAAVALAGRPLVTGGEGQTNEPPESSSVDCCTCEQAMRTLARVRDALTSEPTRHLLARTDKRILLIGLKLKQRINGGLFSNRISVIDFEPKFVELHSILESAFNGQALAYLKRQQQQQVALSDSPLSRPFERRPSAGRAAAAADGKPESAGQLQLIGPGAAGQIKDAGGASRDLLEQQRHLNGSKGEEEESNGTSRDALVRAEWLLYKQLSSALIRTLLVVHVHKLDRQPESASITDPTSNKPLASPLEEEQRLDQLQLQLMADNLLTLEFASSIQRASAMRLRRRKRHLRSHLASSNTSITSNLSARNQRDSAAATPNNWPPNDTLCGYPTRVRHQRKVSLLDASLMLARHRARHTYLSTQTSRRSLTKTGVHGSRLRSHKSSGPDFTESSSMSTSSGGNGLSEDYLFRSPTTAESRVQEWQVHQTRSSRYYTDDSDSLASAYLESRCSSSSRHNRSNRNNSRSPVKHSAIRWPQQRCKQERKVSLDSSAIELSNLSQPRSTPHQHWNDNNSPQSSRAATIMGQSRTSSVIKIDCPPTTSGHQNVASSNSSGLQVTPGQQLDTFCQTPNGFDLPDNVSVADLCNAVAEPPKQLKLEQFLNQFGSIINSPQHQTLPVTQTTVPATGNVFDIGATIATVSDQPLNSSVHRQNNLSSTKSPFNENGIDLTVEEDDEDCKSHSSILDHLSIMALESIAKLNNRACSQEETLNSTPQPPSGHLQRLLNSTQQQKMTSILNSSHVALKDSSGIANQLKALSVNCASHCQDLPTSHDENSPSPASFVHSSTSSSSGFSSAITGSSDNARFHQNANIPPDYSHTVTLTQPNEASNRKQQQENDKMYASVMKEKCNVKV